MKTVEITIAGRVQKVGFRACVRKVATDLSVTGTVFNLPDGRVQIYATAEPMILEKFVSSLYGCPRAVIRDMKIAELPPMVTEGFSIIKNEGRFSTGL
ncbi:MAG TPA: acylphosphatase [Methanoregula sp.]|nr:acylphosphatase [Methanoregula sp.]